MLPVIAVLSLLMALPVYLHTHLHIPEVATRGPHNPWGHLVFCVEDWTYGGEFTIQNTAALVIRQATRQGR